MKRCILLLIVAAIILSGCQNKLNNKNMLNNIRKPKTAGQFYPTDAGELQKKIKKHLDLAPKKKIAGEVKAIIVPHAGYDFSGHVAAYAYKQLIGKKVGTVVIICNSHSTYFNGVAVDNHDAWRTPLGTVEVDKNLAQKLIDGDKVIQYNAQPFATNDQTIEVQIPFLQTVLQSSFKILPIYFGNINDEDYKVLAKALVDNLGDNDIIVASTDMSHYPSYEDANKIDQDSLNVIKLGDVKKLNEYIDKVMSQNIFGEETTMCGVDGVRTVLEIYNLKKWKGIEVLKYANSGDTHIGGRGSVVGYGAVAFAGNAIDDNVLNKSQKQALLNIAKQTVESFVKTDKIPEFNITDERLNKREGAFVTLHREGKLRGCIGQIIPSDEPLWQVVLEMAVAAASEDNRFLPVNEEELDKLDYEISVLSAPERIDDWQKIELGKHGVIVKSGRYSGVFLPQVAAETGWSKEEFLSQLCTQKAGLPADCYKDKDVELLVFTAQVFGGK